MSTDTISDKSSDKPAPDLSAILVTADTFEPIRTTVRALAKQTARERLEIVILCPSKDSLDLVDPELAGFHSVRVIELGEIISAAGARAAGVRAASAPVVAFCEDHAYPEQDWAEALIEAHKQPWAAVGPAFLNANPGVLSWLAIVMHYGRWVEPVVRGPIDDVPGHNSAWKRSLLLEYGPQLESMLGAPTVLNWDLRAKGHKLYLEPSAKVCHLQVSRLGPFLVEHFNVARMFPAQRSRNWPWYWRLFYVAGMPVLLARTLRGWLGHIRRVGRQRELLPRGWPLLLLLLAVTGLGEIMGYSFGMGRAQENILPFDTKRIRFVNRRDRALLAAP